MLIMSIVEGKLRLLALTTLKNDQCCDKSHCEFLAILGKSATMFPLTKDLSLNLLDSGPFMVSEDVDGSYESPEGEQWSALQQQVRHENPNILALSRNRFTLEPPVGRKLEEIKSQMLRIHRASGHTSMSNLQRLLRARKAPQWAIDLAGSLVCPDCIESKKPPSPPVASLHETPGVFEIIGSDIFEYEHSDTSNTSFRSFEIEPVVW